MFVADHNDRFDSYDDYFHLETDEDSEKVLSQDAEESDLFYFIFCNDAHSQAIEEFNID